jgi:transcriptional regulator with XRE-family HTH domain
MRTSLHIATLCARAIVDGTPNDAPPAPLHYVNMAKRLHYLKEWRKFRGLTQQALAEAVATEKSVISLIENEKRGLSDEWAHKLAPILGTTPGFLYDHDPNNLDTELIDAVRQVPAKDRDQALAILKTFRGAG